MTKEEFIGKLQMAYIVDKSKMLLNNPDLLDLYLKIKEVK